MSASRKTAVTWASWHSPWRLAGEPTGPRVQFRTREQVQGVVAGLELVEPGVVPVPERRTDPGTLNAQDRPVPQLACAGLARKP